MACHSDIPLEQEVFEPSISGNPYLSDRIYLLAAIQHLSASDGRLGEFRQS
jgi:hypothetical protein